MQKRCTSVFFTENRTKEMQNLCIFYIKIKKSRDFVCKNIHFNYIVCYNLDTI